MIYNFYLCFNKMSLPIKIDNKTPTIIMTSLNITMNIISTTITFDHHYLSIISNLTTTSTKVKSHL